MTRNDKDIVATFRAALASRLGQARFDLWFGSGVRLQLVGQTLEVAAADQFALDRLRRSLRSDLESVCQEVFGYLPTIDYRMDASLRPSSPPAGKSAGGQPSAPVASNGQSASESTSRRRRFAQLGTFIQGAGNQVAYTAAEMVLQRPGAVSPLLLYGPTGSGKSHLLEGIWTAARQGGRLRRVVFLSAEQFTSYFLEALRGSGLPSFRRKYRDVELLLIDDVQFFAGKRATLVELQHTIDTLLREGRQLVFAADRSPAELSGLGRELSARLSGGLVCGIEPPDQATRLGILKQLAATGQPAVPAPVLQLIATHLAGDARQLAGAFNRLLATSQALGQPITVELAEAALTDIFRTTRRAVRLPDIEQAICEVFGLEPQSLHSGRKSKAVSQPRMLAMWLARKHTRAAFSEIGHYFGRRSHSTVISAQKKVTGWISNSTAVEMPHGNCPVEDAIRRVEAQLRSG